MLSRSAAILLFSFTVSPLRAQCGDPLPILIESERERYLRSATRIDTLVGQPWTLRPFSPAQARGMSRIDLPSSSGETGRHASECSKKLAYDWLPARISVLHNASFPLGWNDGAVW